MSTSHIPALKATMADEQNGVNSPPGTVDRTNDENTNNNSVTSSNYPAYLASTQYWQYYYTYSLYYNYYSSYYYNVLCQQGLQNQVYNSQNNLGFPGIQQNLPQIRQRITDGSTNGQRVATAEASETRYEFVIASLGKRAFAEFIDFVFLFFIKYISYALYYKNADQIAQIQYILILDEATNLKEIEDILVQALLYRLIVFLYEAFFIAVPILCPFGGATPGKYMMGITVICYQGLTPVQGQNLRRFSGTASRRLHLWQACVRAVLKNFMITFFFPIMFTAMFLQNYRTPYDLVASSIVVEANPKRQRSS